jgi:hypothetical protein
MQDFYSQGDVGFLALRELPAGARKIHHDGILARGEATGHSHRIVGLDNVEVYELAARLLLKVNEGGISIAHEQHRELALEAGVYEVTRDRTFDYTEQVLKKVVD